MLFSFFFLESFMLDCVSFSLASYAFSLRWKLSHRSNVLCGFCVIVFDCITNLHMRASSRVSDAIIINSWKYVSKISSPGLFITYQVHMNVSQVAMDALVTVGFSEHSKSSIHDFHSSWWHFVDALISREYKEIFETFTGKLHSNEWTW